MPNFFITVGDREQRAAADGRMERVQVGMLILLNWASASYCLKYLKLGTNFVLLFDVCNQLDLED